ENLPFEEVVKQIDEYGASLHLVFTLAQFDNLVKTGRMNAIAGAIASHLGIRAVAVNSPKGEIEVVRKVRGEEKALAAMVDIMCQTKEMKGKPVVISQCQNKSGAELVKKLIKEKCDTSDITIYDCKALTTFYAMEKGLLISY
ncbi:MAG: DegV family protein, partial [Oscillospiraceae bacterium]